MKQQVSTTEATTVTESNTTPIRIQRSTKAFCEQIVKRINANGGERKIKFDAIIMHALKKLDDKDIKELQDSTVTNTELFEREFRRYRRKHKDTTRDQFLGLVITGTVKIPQIRSLPNAAAE